MTELISREAAIAYAISGRTREIEGEKWIRVSEVRESLQAAASADAQEVRHGRWEWDGEYICSVCGYREPYRKPPFCGGCGASMDGFGGVDNE